MSATPPGALLASFRHSRFSTWLLAAVSTHQRVALVVFLSTFACCILFATLFSTRGYPGRDSGIFLYVAQLILDGKIPYRDAWDNKPPGIFYVDALGLFLGRGSLAGLWLVEFVSLCASVLLCVKALDRAFGLSAAFFGSMTWLIGLMLLFTTEGGNLTEEYAIPFKFAAFWLFLECEAMGYWGWRGFALGATGAIALLFRQNLIGVHLAIAVYLLLTRAYHRQVLRLLTEWTWVLVGGAAVVAAVCTYFAANSALSDLVDVAFLYNLSYSAASMQERLSSIVAGFGVLSRSGIGVLALASWLAGLVYLVTGRHMRRDARRLLALAVIAFPIELLLVSASIREYAHYYEAWLPVIAVLAGFFASCFLVLDHSDHEGPGIDALAGIPVRPAKRAGFGARTWQAVLVLGMAMMPVYATLAVAVAGGGPAPVIARAAAYVRDFTQPGDYVLVWGADVSINFVSQRPTSSRFIHQYPLFTSGYVTPEMMARFLADLEAHPPTLIIDTSPVNDHIPPIDDRRRSSEGWTRWGPNGFYASSPETDELFVYLNRNYKEKTQLVERGKTVFVYERRVAEQ